MTYPYTIIRSKRRHVSAALLVRPSGEVIVQAPLLMPKFMLDQFVNSHTRWIEKRLKELQIPQTTPISSFDSISSFEEYVTDSLTKYASKMSLKANHIKFRKVKSYWGNCKSDGTITFNLDLMYAKKKEIDYVIIHELAHIRYRSHGVRFWELVNRYCTHTQESRKELRVLGSHTRNIC